VISKYLERLGKTEVNCSKAFTNSIKKLIPHIAFYDKNFN
jgi:hypothetical protein